MERALAEDGHQVDARASRHPLEEVEVGEAAPRGGEVLVHRSDLVEQRVRHEDAVALPLTVEPVAAADEVADVEEPVAVDRASRSPRRAGPRSPRRSPSRRPRAADRAHVPLLGADHGGRVGRHASIAEAQTPGVSTWAPSIITATPPASRPDSAVQRVRGRGRRLLAEVEVVELGAEAAHEVLAEPLVGRRSRSRPRSPRSRGRRCPAGRSGRASAACAPPRAACCGHDHNRESVVAAGKARRVGAGWPPASGARLTAACSCATRRRSSRSARAGLGDPRSERKASTAPRTRRCRSRR